VEEIKFTLATPILSQQVFTFNPTTHLPPATQDMNDVTLTHSSNPHSVKHTFYTLFDSELKNFS